MYAWLITFRFLSESLFIIVELCQNGNLYEYIKARRNCFLSQVVTELIVLESAAM